MNDEFAVEGISTKDNDLLSASLVEQRSSPITEIDPERDKDNWPTIIIDMENEKPNYEYVAAHGTMRDGSPFSRECQIQRGVEVKVAPSIVRVLQTAVSAHFVQRPDPITGKMIMDRQDRSSIPWRLVKAGKYFA